MSKVRRVYPVIFSGVVLGRRRYCALALQKRWHDLDSAELVMANTPLAYAAFYKGATEDDLNAVILDRRLEIPRNSKVILETKKGRKLR